MTSGKPFVLVMDDHELMCETLQEILTGKNCDVVVFSGKMHAFSEAEAFLSSSESRRPDSLLLDIVINGEGGLDLAQKAVRKWGYRPSQVVFLTGCHESSSELRSKKYKELTSLGIRTVFKEPMDLDALTSAVLESAGTSERRV